MAAKRKPSITATAKKRFGWQTLRPGQEEAVRSLLDSTDTLVVQPTGSGKSAVYQLIGAMSEGVVLVVSPLIALQKDQVDFLNTNGRDEALVINSGLKASELHDNYDRLINGKAKYLFLAPEQFANEETSEVLAKLDVSLFAIDEAHCVSEWGHDFRPDYLQLGHVIERFKHPPVLAMTATASERVRAEIIERLCMKKPTVILGGFDRPNIYLRVDHFDEADKKMEALLHRARWADKPGIVYTGTRKAAEDVAAKLQEDSVSAAAYHAGLATEEREQIQDRFMAGDLEVIAATNAFGMGIDKADVRFVYHLDAPDSLDAYYQEIGRAGRDGERAEAILFFRPEDIGAQAYHSGSGRARGEEMQRISEALAEEGRAVDMETLEEETDLSRRQVATVVQQLEDAGAVKVLRSGKVRQAKNADAAAAIMEVAERGEERKDERVERLEEMRSYADASNCRRETLLQYFGERYSGPCCNCDRCEQECPEITVDPSVGTRREVA